MCLLIINALVVTGHKYTLSAPAWMVRYSAPALFNCEADEFNIYCQVKTWSYSRWGKDQILVKPPKYSCLPKFSEYFWISAELSTQNFPWQHADTPCKQIRAVSCTGFEWHHQGFFFAYRNYYSPVSSEGGTLFKKGKNRWTDHI